MKSPIIIICGPTAVGKTVIINQVLRQLPNLKTGISYMTRSARPGMTEDKKVIHVSKRDFREKISSGKLLEWSEYGGHLYGTSKDSLTQGDNNPVLLNLDANGSLQIKKLHPYSLLIFIDPESLGQIRQRLTSRGLSAEDFQKRWTEAQKALSLAPKFDLRIVNRQGQLEQTVKAVVKAIDSYVQSFPTIDKKR